MNPRSIKNASRVLDNFFPGFPACQTLAEGWGGYGKIRNREAHAQRRCLYTKWRCAQLKRYADANNVRTRLLETV